MSQIPKVAIFIPTYKRVKNIERVYKSIEDNTTSSFEVYFIVEPEDVESTLEIKRLGYNMIYNKGIEGYPDSINTAYYNTTEHIFLIGSDDLIFHPNWLENAFNWFGKGVEVVGLNSLHDIAVETGNTAKNCLVKRSYIKRWSGVVNEPNTVLHNYPYYMEEFVETAKSRGMFLVAKTAKVEVPITIDDVHEKEGLEIYEERRKLWEIL